MIDGFVKVARMSEIAEKHSMRVIVGDEQIALWRVDGTVYAINNVCPHQHFPVLHQATLDGIKVTCPMHGWTYSLETGCADAGSGKVKTHRVKVIGDDIFLEQPVESW